MILSLKYESGNWQHEPHDIKESITRFFSALYISSPPPQSPTNTTGPNSQSHVLFTIQKVNLALPLGDSEIKKAIFSFKTFKAPGPDGLHLFFYQKYWDIVGKNVIQFCKECFVSKTMHPKMIETLLCLIPKFP